MFNRKNLAIWLVLLTYLALALLVGSCSTKPDSAPPVNIAPKVEIVNIPPNNSHFTANPQIYWFGTDVDGFIIAYEYAVVPESLLERAGVDTSNEASVLAYAAAHINEPREGVDCVPDSCWQYLDVKTADNPNKQTIRLFADPNPQVSLEQLFFVRAVDNDSTRSGIDYRIYSRSNHAPDTEIKTVPDSGGYFDQPETTLTYKGIAFEWAGSDKIDYPTDNPAPTFDYFYQVFGPFNHDDLAWIDTGHVEVIDSENFDTLAAASQNRLIVTSHDTTSNTVWVPGNTAKFYNLWRDQPPTDTTETKYFVLKVTSRDDAFVSDPTPAYTAFFATNPKMEKDLLVYVIPAFAKGETIDPGSIFSSPISDYASLDTLMAFYRQVFSDAGYEDAAFFEGQEAGSKKYTFPSKAMLAHYKVYLVIAEGSGGVIDPAHLAGMAPYLDLGGDVWLWAHQPFAAIGGAGSVRGTQPLGGERVPAYYFNVIGEYNPAWVSSYTGTRLPEGQAPCRKRGSPYLPTNEQFTGGLALAGTQMPDFEVNLSKVRRTYLTFLVDTFYIQCCSVYAGPELACQCTLRVADPALNCPVISGYKGVDWGGEPSVSYFIRDVYSEPVFLFQSRFGDFIPDSLKQYYDAEQGRVVGLRYNSGQFKTAVYGFSMWCMHEQDAVEVFRKSMQWFLGN